MSNGFSHDRYAKNIKVSLNHSVSVFYDTFLSKYNYEMDNGYFSLFRTRMYNFDRRTV